MTPSVLLVGGNGFLGSHLIDALLAAGYAVRVLDNMAERFRPPVVNVKYFIGTFTDQSLLHAALSGCDVVIHLAHNSLPPSSPQQSEQAIQENAKAFSILLDQTRHCGVQKLVFFSSGGAVYGESHVSPVSEGVVCCPISPYGHAKFLMEQMLMCAHQTHGLDHIVVRPSNPFGPRQDFRGQQGVIPIFLHRLLTGQPISIWGDGTAVKDYLYVSDLAAAVLALIQAGFDNTAYNVGSGQGTSLRVIISLLEADTGCRAQVKYESAHATDVKNNVLAITKLERRTGWQPRVSLAEGIYRTHCWYEVISGAAGHTVC
jgi:UDP-glucose 4-epimerase